MASAIKITLTPAEGEKIEKSFEGNSITIGRSKTCTFTVNSESLSRQHCLIELVNGEFYITDLGSTNGVYIEGTRIEPHQRIRFNNFLNLQISNYDFQVVELEDDTVFSQHKLPPKQDTTQNLAPTKATKKINFEALNSPLPQPKKVNSDQSKLRSVIFVVIFLLIAVTAYLAIEMEEDDDDTDQGQVQVKQLSPAAQAKAEAEKIKTANAFHKDYETLMFAKSCKEGSYCQNLSLSTTHNEGLYEQEKELFIFINPPAHTLEKYSKLSSENMELIALDLLFNSLFLEAYFRGTYEQIHLVLISPLGTPEKVLRFHVSKYNLQTSQLEMIIPLLKVAIEQNNPKPLIEVLYPLIDILDLASNK